MGLFLELGELRLRHSKRILLTTAMSDFYVAWNCYCTGPCTIDGPNGTKYNPYSWNTNANIFFIDQPVGVGFSYAGFGETVVRRNVFQFICLILCSFVDVFSHFFFHGWWIHAMPHSRPQKKPPRTSLCLPRLSLRRLASSRAGTFTWRENRMQYVLSTF